MFDIGFSELVIIGVVALLVVGPERLPGAIRTGSAWLNRFKRGFNDIKREVQQELHNDSVMQELRKTGEQLQQETDSFGHTLHSASAALAEPVLPEDSSETPAGEASAGAASAAAASAGEPGTSTPPADKNPS